MHAQALSVHAERTGTENSSKWVSLGNIWLCFKKVLHIFMSLSCSDIDTRRGGLIVSADHEKIMIIPVARPHVCSAWPSFSASILLKISSKQA